MNADILKALQNGPSDMYQATGLAREQLADLCELIRMEIEPMKQPWPPNLGLWNSTVVALTYMKRNQVQAEVSETYGVSQPTISCAPTTATPPIGQVLAKFVPTADELDDQEQYIVDGTLPAPGVLVTVDPGNRMGDEGYVENGMITPIKKPAGHDLSEGRKNSTSKSTRCAVPRESDR